MKTYPKVLAAIRKADSQRWDVGDALLREGFKPVQSEQPRPALERHSALLAAKKCVRDKIRKKFAPVSLYLAQNGRSPYSPKDLNAMAAGAFNFPPGSRDTALEDVGGADE